jgi:hypothetical protein
MKQKTFSVVRASVPDSLDKDSKTFLGGDLLRFCSLHSGHVLASDSLDFFILDLDGSRVQVLTRIFETRGIVCELRLVSSSFFEKLFTGEVV